MIALAAFRVAAYVRSHRVYQALLMILALLAIVHGSRAPRGLEVPALTDSAALIIPFLAWAARSLLDTEPDRQRELSATIAGGRRRELAAGLLAALAVCVTFDALALAWGVLLGVSATPQGAELAAVLALHVLAVLAGLALGALTSRAILPSPAVSIMALLGGFLVMLLVSASPLHWLSVPVTAWMRAASAGLLADRLPALGAASLAWCLIGLAAYAWLRRTRP
ncbi:hypothetical protein [Nonomuraea sp. SBT364]|uniref:hypothetical protein n=1 Tax=Nonomuraea sp. SBT364 TaxID=1580530 RepID=UPI00066AE027|nr:hypothetical protein [Nonomuraea sp. SBT364]